MLAFSDFQKGIVARLHLLVYWIGRKQLRQFFFNYLEYHWQPPSSPLFRLLSIKTLLVGYCLNLEHFNPKKGLALLGGEERHAYTHIHPCKDDDDDDADDPTILVQAPDLAWGTCRRFTGEQSHMRHWTPSLGSILYSNTRSGSSQSGSLRWGMVLSY